MKEPQRESLFDASQYDNPPQHPGDLHPEDWVKQPGVQHHATFRRDFMSAPTIHMGTEPAARSRLLMAGLNMKNPLSRRLYYDPQTTSGDVVPKEHLGRMHALRMTTESEHIGNTMERFGKMDAPEGTSRPGWAGYFVRATGDANANAGDMHFWMRQGKQRSEIPASIRESAVDTEGAWIQPQHALRGRIDISEMTGQGARAARALAGGKSLSYANEVEGGTSYVARPSTLRTWEQDVLDSPNRSEMAKQYAQQRIDQGRAGQVDFDPDPPGLTNYVVQHPLDFNGEVNVRHLSGEKTMSSSPILGAETIRTPLPRRRLEEFRMATP